MEATSLQFYQDLCRQAWDGIFNIKSWDVCNSNIRRVMKEIETFILWHYQYGSKYDTPFWEYAKSLPFNPDNKFYYNGYNGDYDSDDYGHWNSHSFKCWRNGVE